MTQVKRISLAEMVDETGLAVPGYARPVEDEILLVDGLPKAAEKEILAHEADHIMRGEEGPFLGDVFSAVAGPLIGKVFGDDGGAKRSARAQEKGAQEALAENRRQFDLSMLMNVLLNLPSMNAGNVARSQYLSDLGLSTPGADFSGIIDLLNSDSGGGSGTAGGIGSKLGAALKQMQAPGSTPTAPAALADRVMATPGAQFLVDETTDNIMGNNAALGLREAGVTSKQVGDRVGQGLLLPLYQDLMNRQGALAGLGSSTSSNVAANAGTLATNAGGVNAGLIQNAADARASGILGNAGQKNLFANDISGAVGDFMGSKTGKQFTGWLDGLFGG